MAYHPYPTAVWVVAPENPAYEILCCPYCGTRILARRQAHEDTAWFVPTGYIEPTGDGYFERSKRRDRRQRTDGTRRLGRLREGAVVTGDRALGQHSGYGEVVGTDGVRRGYHVVQLSWVRRVKCADCTRIFEMPTYEPIPSPTLPDMPSPPAWPER